MEYPGTYFTAHFPPTLDAMVSFDHRRGVPVHATSSELSSVSYPQTTTSFSYAPWGNDCLGPRHLITGSGIVTEHGFPLLPEAPTFYPPTSFPTSRINNISDDINPPAPSSTFLGPSETSICDGAQQAPEDNAFVAGTKFIPPHEQDKTRCIYPSTTDSIVSEGQVVLANPQSKHFESWYLICKNAIIVDGPRLFVPQTIYQPQHQGDKDRYISLAELQPPITFLRNNSPQWGVPISQLLSKQLKLVEGDEPAFASCGPSIGIRINWPGYQPFHKQVPTRDYTPGRRMISKEKLAKIVARSVKKFMDDVNKKSMEAGSDRRWKVGPLGIQVGDIILVSLHHVSRGSWQPQLRLRRIIGGGVAGA